MQGGQDAQARFPFLEHAGEAVKEFDEAIKIGDVPGGAFRDAIEGKRKLGMPR